MTGQHIKQDTETGEWSHPNSTATLAEAGLWTIEEYIDRRKNTILRYARERAIYEQCLNSTPAALSSRKKICWELDSINYLADDA